MGESLKGEVTYVFLWLIHVDVWQKQTKFYKAVILQLKKKMLDCKKNKHALPSNSYVEILSVMP